MVVYERIPDDLWGTYWSGQQKAKVTADHVTFTLVDGWGNQYKRVYAPVGSGSGSDPFAQPDGNGVFVVDINHDTSTLTYLDNMLKSVSPSLKYDMYTLDTQFVFMPTNVFTVPAVIGSPATGRAPTYEFTVNLEGHLVTFTLATSYLSPVPFPDFSHSPSTNMGETTGANSARSAQGSQGAASTGTTSRSNTALNPGSSTVTETGGGVSSGAGGDVVFTGDPFGFGGITGGGVDTIGNVIPQDPLRGRVDNTGNIIPGMTRGQGAVGANIIKTPVWRGGAFERDDFYREMQALGYRGTPTGSYVPIPYTKPPSSSMGSAPMIIGGVSVMALLLLLSR